MGFVTDKTREMIKVANHERWKFGYMVHGTSSDHGTPWIASDTKVSYCDTIPKRKGFFDLLRASTPRPRLEPGAIVYFDVGWTKYRVLLTNKNGKIWEFEVLDEIPEKHTLPTKAVDTAFAWIPGERKRENNG